MLKNKQKPELFIGCSEMQRYIKACPFLLLHKMYGLMKKDFITFIELKL